MTKKTSLLQDMIAIRRSNKNKEKELSKEIIKPKIGLILNKDKKFINELKKENYELINLEKDEELYKRLPNDFYKRKNIQELKQCSIVIFDFNDKNNIIVNSLLLGIISGINEMVKESNMTRHFYNELSERVEEMTDLKEPVRALMNEPIDILILQKEKNQEKIVNNIIDRWGKTFNNKEQLLDYLMKNYTDE